ncbi:MAG: PASTA domain-containing protein [Clostridia bacterium]|nr:PASTA domain-containing protein [Clostridia bacterium]
MKSGTKSMYIRTIAVFVVFAMIAIFLCGRLFKLQILEYDQYLGKVLDNLMQVSVIKAQRGVIYDRNMQKIAANVTTYRVFISPADIATDEDRATISQELSKILDVSYDTIYEKALKVKRKDETIKEHVDKATADKVRAVIDKYGYTRQIYLQTTSKRYYPFENSAAQVIGYMGMDGGLFGLELQYNELLTGTDGKYITARNAKSESMPSKYDVKIDPENGYSLVTTLDMNIQAILENQLQQTYEENMVGNNVCGIVMDVHTGAVLAMATNWGFDLNTPYTLVGDYADELTFSGLDKNSEEYNELKWELIYSMWRNKCVSETYEPGSTFKVITSAIGLETGKVTENTSLRCDGEYVVSGVKIKCHKIGGHGTGSFSYLLQQSCNPAMMKTAELIGRDTFWKYFEEFGYLKKTGIDLPGEAAGINHTFSGFHSVEMATSSFGQTFKTTPIQQLTAICAVANGGHVVTPYVVESLIDDDGNVVIDNAKESKRQIISEEVCNTLSEILEGGVREGVASNAYVAGYKIAAKTGTSEKRDAEDKSLRVGSTVAFAPANDPQIAVLIVVDEPGGPVKSGGTVAAPYVASVVDQTLQYLNVEKVYTDKELAELSFEVGDYVNKDVAKTLTALESSGITCRVIGTGNTVYSQLPLAGDKMRKEKGVVYLYTYDPAIEEQPPVTENEYETVPDVTGMKVSAAIMVLTDKGFNVNITGSLNYGERSGAQVISQSASPGTSLQIGAVITIESMHTDVSDNG